VGVFARLVALSLSLPLFLPTVTSGLTSISASAQSISLFENAARKRLITPRSAVFKKGRVDIG